MLLAARVFARHKAEEGHQRASRPNRRNSCSSARIGIAVSVSMHAKTPEPPHRLAVRIFRRDLGQARVQAPEPRLGVIDGQLVILDDGPLPRDAVQVRLSTQRRCACVQFLPA
jgi:hypothetical protein